MRTTKDLRRTATVLGDGTVVIKDVDDIVKSLSAPTSLTSLVVPLSPAEISPGNLELWLDAEVSATLTLNGSDVTDWRGRDEDLNQYNFDGDIPTSNIQLVSNAINGKDSVAFDGVNDCAINQTASNFNFAHRDSYTLAVVMKLNATSPGDEQTIVSNSNSSADHGIELVADDNNATARYQFAVRRGVGGFSNSTVGIQRNNFWVSNAWQYFIIVWDNAGDVCRTKHSIRGNVTDAELNPPSTNAASRLMTIGSRNNGSKSFNGEITQMVMWNVAITPSQVLGLSSYFFQEFGL